MAKPILYFAICTLLIALKGFLSWHDGYFSQSQLLKARTHGYSFISHGNIWGDLGIISLLCAFIIYMHPPPVLTRESGMTAAVVVVLAICFVIKDENATREIPTAFARFGKISIAGWLHLVYFSLNLYVIIMYYFTRNNASNFELCTVGLSLCIYSLLSIMKFPLSTWKIDTFSKVLVVAEILLVGIATYVKAFR